jgi:hypothetical protein
VRRSIAEGALAGSHFVRTATAKLENSGAKFFPGRTDLLGGNVSRDPVDHLRTRGHHDAHSGAVYAAFCLAKRFKSLTGLGLRGCHLGRGIGDSPIPESGAALIAEWLLKDVL